MKTYALPQDLLQAIVSTLNQQPAGQVRPLLNAIEQTCLAQDQAEKAKADAEAREALKAELLAEAKPASELAPA